MGGVRKDGILQVNTSGGGPGSAVDITAPLGPNTMADSVSITVATDQTPIPVSSTAPSNTTASGTISAFLGEVSIDVPDGYNSVFIILEPTAFDGQVVFLSGTVAIGGDQQLAFNLAVTGRWTAAYIDTGLNSGKFLYSVPAVSGRPFTVVSNAYNSGSLAVELFASMSASVQNTLTAIELAATTVTVNTELPTATALADNMANPTAPAVGAFGMIWDGIEWHRDITPFQIRDAIQSLDGKLPATAALADNTANPTLTKIQNFNMVFDGATWDRWAGGVDTELPTAVALADNTPNPTVPGVGAFLMAWDGASWDRVPGNSVGLTIRPLNAATDSISASVIKSDLTASAPTVVSVGVASASAVAATATRRGLILRNLSTARISLGFGGAAVLDSGVTLYPLDAYAMGEYDFDQAVVNAIASAAASPLAIQEYTI